jgi:hypothetical protein
MGILSFVFLASANAQSQNQDKLNVQKVTQFISGWATIPKEVAAKTMAKYGSPDEATATMLIWYNNGPWKKTIVFKEEIPHDFPKPHTDLLQQFVDYKTPLEKYAELAIFDGSVIVERTKGDISARCDKEEMNMLALNLANDVATDKKTVEEARAYYLKAAMDFMQGKMDTYVQELKFNTGGNTKDPDAPVKL